MPVNRKYYPWILAAVLALPVYGQTRCQRVLKLIGQGLVQEASYYALLPLDAVEGALKFFGRDGFIVTRRGTLSYLKALRLRPRDIKGKVLLDLGSGRSPFTPTLNAIYGSLGTQAISLDRNANPPTGPHARFIQADARDIPLPDNSVDMVTSHWFFNLFMPDWTNPTLSDFKKEQLTQLLDEAIRVTKPGGEIRLTYHFTNLGPGGLPFVKRYLKSKVEVSAVEDYLPKPFTGLLKIRLSKDMTPPAFEPPPSGE